MMQVTDWAKWQRTKCIVAIVLLLIAIGCAGGLESETGTEPLPSATGFVTAITLLTLLTINIYKGDNKQ
jgi:hypothetical protein